LRNRSFSVLLGVALALVAAACGSNGPRPRVVKVAQTPTAAPVNCGEGPFNFVAENPQPDVEKGTLVTSSAKVAATISGPRVSAKPRVWVDAVPSRIEVDDATEFDTTFDLDVGPNTVVIARGDQCQQFTLQRLSEAQIADARAKAVAAAKARAAAHARAVAAAKTRAAAAEQRFIDSAQTIPYADLIKSTSPYLGEKVKLYGQIFQIQQAGGGGFMLLSVTNEGYGLWDDNVWVDYSGHNSYVDNNLITVYATVTGTKSYTTQAGGETYVPEVRAKYIQGS